MFQDIELAIKWLTRTAEQGNEYAKFFLDNLDKFRYHSLDLGISIMRYHTGRIFEEKMLINKSAAIGLKIDSKLLLKLVEKKVDQGY
jgi:TPR repeat protein